MSDENKNRARSALLFEYLLHSTSEAEPVTTEKLCAYLECNRKTLAREIEALQTCGFPVLSTRCGRQNAYYYKVSDLTTAEMQIWLDEAHAAGYISETLENRIVSHVEAISGREGLSKLQKSVLRFNARKHAGVPILETVMTIQHALEIQSQMSFLYFKWDEGHNRIYRHSGERYVVSPVAMVNRDDNYYLLTYNTEKRRVYPFRIDRIEAAKVEQQPACMEALAERFHVAEYTKQVFKMFGGELQHVVLQFTDDVISYIFDKFGADTVIKRLGPDCCRAEVDVQVSAPFFAWVFMFDGRLRIVEPAALKDAYRQKLTSAIKEDQAPC